MICSRRQASTAAGSVLTAGTGKNDTGSFLKSHVAETGHVTFFNDAVKRLTQIPVFTENHPEAVDTAKADFG